MAKVGGALKDAAVMAMAAEAFMNLSPWDYYEVNHATALSSSIRAALGAVCRPVSVGTFMQVSSGRSLGHLSFPGAICALQKLYGLDMAPCLRSSSITELLSLDMVSISWTPL